MVVPDDIYKQDVDFVALAMQFADLAKKLKPNGQLDFSDPESVRQLTKALLRRDFQLHIELPEDRLCPPVPNRFNYIVFAQKLIDSTRFDYSNSTPSDERIIGLDIGTGASAIYPLLACRQRSNWFFLATEKDSKSREYANCNVKANDLQSRIRVVAPDGPGQTEGDAEKILPSSQYSQFDDYSIKIQLTNPPFYTSTDDLLHSASLKIRPPNTSCTGSAVEMITPGGEVQFLTQIIHESRHIENRTKIQWFSGMLGKLSNVPIVVDELQKHNCTNYVVTEFLQGQKTRRWCIAWSWTGMRPETDIARGISSGAAGKKILPFPSEFTFKIPLSKLFEDKVNQVSQAIITNVAAMINTEIKKLDGMEWQYAYSPLSQASPYDITSNKTNGISTSYIKAASLETGEFYTVGVGKTKIGDVWSRKARRKHLHPQPRSQIHEQNSIQENSNNGIVDAEMKDSDQDPDSNSENDQYNSSIVFAYVISLFTNHNRYDHGHQQSNTSTTASVKSDKSETPILIHIRWLQGHDSVLFESFCGWLKRKTLQ